MSAISKYTSLSIIALSLFISLNTQSMEMEDDDSTNQYLLHQIPTHYSYSETDQIKAITMTIDHLFDVEYGAEEILSSLKKPIERLVVVETTCNLLLNKDSLSQQKALHALILLNSDPSHNKEEFRHVKEMLNALIKNITQIEDNNVLKKIFELKSNLIERETTFISDRINKATKAQEDGKAMLFRIENDNQSEDEDSCILF